MFFVLSVFDLCRAGHFGSPVVADFFQRNAGYFVHHLVADFVERNAGNLWCLIFFVYVMRGTLCIIWWLIFV